MDKLRIVLLGKTGDGKSSSGNVILCEDTFPTRSSPKSHTQNCCSYTKTINKKEITVIDTPGFFDPDLSSEQINSEILRCFTECAPGLHAFVIVLRVGRYTEQESEVVKKITKVFGEDVLKYAVVLFTFGDQLSEDQTIEDFVKQSSELQDLVNKCGGRVHVIDNKYWTKQQDGYRSNRVQVEELLNTIEKMVQENGVKFYTNEILQIVEKAIEKESKALCKDSNIGPDNIVREQAKQTVFTKLLKILAGVGTGVLLGALFGIGVSVIIVIKTILLFKKYAAEVVSAGVVAMSAAGVGAVSAAGVGAVSAAGAIGVGVVGAGAIGGATAGGIAGYNAAQRADTVTDAVKMTCKDITDAAAEVIHTMDLLTTVNNKEMIKFD